MEVNRRTAPGHPVKYIFHRSSFDIGPQYRNIADWQFEKSKSLYRKNLLAHFGCVNAIEFSNDGSLLVSGGDDRRVLLWNMNRATVCKEEPEIMQAEHSSNVFSLDFSRSAEKIISAGNDDQVIIHDISTGTPLDYFVHEQAVYGVSADPVNESIFCSACDDGRVLIFDIRDSGNDPFCLAKLTSAFHSVMFHPVEPRLVVTANSKEGVASWDVRMPKRVFVKYGLQNANQCCMSARFNKMGNQILVLRRRLPPILYATDSPSHLYQFHHRGYYNSCTMKSCTFAGQNDQYVLSGSDNFDLHLWKIPLPGSDQWVNKAHYILRGHRSIVNQVRYNYVHNLIASSGVEKLIKLWSPFPMQDETGGGNTAPVTNESERRIYTPDDYVSLVMQAGQGNFMSLTFEAGRKTTKEDSRMLAFFDALVQRDINGMSDEDSDTIPETSYTDTIYSSPESSSSENEDEDSNPPNFRNHIPSEPITTTFNRLRRIISDSRREGNVAASSSDPPASTSETNDTPDSPPAQVPDQGESEENSSSNNHDISDSYSQQGRISSAVEDRDLTANMITQLILEKEDTRRQLTKRSKEDSSSTESDSEADSDNVSSFSKSHLNTSRRRGGHNSESKSKYHSKYLQSRKEFKKKLLQAKRRELMSTPVYESSRNSNEILTGSSISETSFERISELMTRNQTIDRSDSSLSSSSTSTCSSSTSTEDTDIPVDHSVIKGTRKKAIVSKRSRVIISSSDSSSSESENNVRESEHQVQTQNIIADNISNEAGTSTSSQISFGRDHVKRKRRPACKLNEACRAFFKKYMDSDVESHRSHDQDTRLPYKRSRLENVENLTLTDSVADNNSVEKVTFKRLAKHKDRNYRKGSTNDNCGTPPDSGIDVSKEPEPCCSKTFISQDTVALSDLTPVSHVQSEARTNSNNGDEKTKVGKRVDPMDDPGIGHVFSDDGESE